jgi:hypothetical protein
MHLAPEVVAVELELPQLAAAAVTQLANTPLLQELHTQSSLVKVVNDRRTPKQLHSQVLPHDVMQVLVAVHLEWELLRTPILGLPAVDAQQFGWLLELRTS